MNMPICGPTAFRFHRVPPQILALYPSIESGSPANMRCSLPKNQLVIDLLELPLHRMTDTDCQRTKTTLFKTHVYAGELPFGITHETDHGFEVTTPAFTLFSMAGGVSRVHLLMAAYELCGSFAVFHPTNEMESMLVNAQQQGIFPLGFGWERVKDTNGNGTSLWKRGPLLSIDELQRLANQLEGRHGAKNLRWVAEYITGICASPFEVQASILLGLPRRFGGQGLPLLNNYRIPLTDRARALYPHSCCYADIFLETSDACSAIDIECQGRSVHASELAGISDAERLAAMESMGIPVVPLTFKQLVHEHSFEAVMHLIEQKRGTVLRPKTPKLQSVERDLRREVFINWETLGFQKKKAGWSRNSSNRPAPKQL